MNEKAAHSTAPAAGKKQGVSALPVHAPLDREQAILDFNRRVLAQAERADVPLLERLRYVTIVSSNLDEFFEVRFADYLEAVRASDDPASRRDMDDLAAAAHQLIDAQYTLFNDQVMPALARAGIVILNHAQRTAAQRRWVARVFQNQVRPLLVPVGLDPAHPFPLVANKSLNFIVRLAWWMTSMPACASAGITCSLNSAYCASVSACALAASSSMSWRSAISSEARTASR